MKSYTTLRNLFGSLSNNTATENLTLGDQLINDAYRSIVTERDWGFLEKSTTGTTTASTQFYNLPSDIDRLNSVTITIGTQIYTPTECPSRDMWDELNRSTLTSDIPEYYYVFNGQVGFFPTPSSSSNTITYIYRRRVTDLVMADYTTGNVSALTSGSTSVTGSGTSWTAPMGGRFIQITTTNTAGQSGDNLWYEISSVGSGTTITLTRNYNGTTITGNTAYTIGQMPMLPETYHQLPVYGALAIYFASVQPELQRSQMYDAKFKEGLMQLRRDFGNKTSNPVIQQGLARRRMLNPNLTVSSIG